MFETLSIGIAEPTNFIDGLDLWIPLSPTLSRRERGQARARNITCVQDKHFLST